VYFTTTIRPAGVATIAALCGVLCASAALTARADSPPVDSEKPVQAPTEAAVEPQPPDLGRRVEAFVHAVTNGPGVADSDSLVRWNAPICLFVTGLQVEDSKTASTRLKQAIMAAGAPLARESCRPNFVIIVTSEPERILEAWYARNKQLFGDATLSQIHHFLAPSGSRPIRVWRNIDRGRTAGSRFGHFVPSNNDAESSSFVRNAVLNFSSVFAIVDSNSASHATLDQQTDYIAMAGLSNVDLDADIGSAPSILRLFVSDTVPPPTLSPWDEAFLKALYQSDQTSRSQRGEIVERMMYEIARSK
jgi:hypothetical protein